MTGDSPLVVVVAGSETLSLRIRLMVEQAGGRVVAAETEGQALGQLDAQGPALVVASAGVPRLVARYGCPVVELGARPDWAALAARLGELTRGVEARMLDQAARGTRVLVVDDSVTYREYLRLDLEAEGAGVRAVSSADDALALLAAEDFDCVLMDLVMPGVDGVELCGRVAELRRLRRLATLLVVLSSRETPDDLRRSLEAGADEFLGKGQDMAAFKLRLKAMLRRKALTDSLKGHATSVGGGLSHPTR